MKKILGLDLGTNSIGAALLNVPESIGDYGKEGNIEWIGSRIIPVDGDYLQKFQSGGQVETKAAARRIKRGSRRLKQRYKLRRTRLIQVFKILGWLNESFPLDDFRTFKKRTNEDESYRFHLKDYLPFEKETIEKATELFGVKDKRNKHGNIIIPEDWIIYYVRAKALTEKISIAELCRITYMMNQRRGFKSSRKDLKEEGIKEKKWVEILKIKSVELKSNETDKNKKFTYTITPYSDTVKPWEEKRFKKPEWEEKEFTFLITEKTDEKGKISQLKPQIPTPDDWALSMVALDNKIDNQDKYPGKFFFNQLVKDKNYKIRQIAVKREKYKNELETIWNTQIELRKHDNTEQEILNETKIEQIALALYKHNQAKQMELKEKNLLEIISNDIIYYQRELKSQKNSVSECRYEKLVGKEKNTDGELIETGIYGIKCAAKSSPEFQEFRIWQDIHNIRIFEKEVIVNGVTKIDVDVTKAFIDDMAKESLFELFDKSKDISEQAIFTELNKLQLENKLNTDKYRINLFANREKLLGNETKELFRRVFKKYSYEVKGEKLLSNKEIFRKLWHIYYSISSSDATKSEKGIRTALSNLPLKIDEMLPKEIIEAFTKLPEPKKQYASYSTKAIKKLLPLMRCGTKWSWTDIENTSLQKSSKLSLATRIEGIINGEWNFAYDKRTGEFIKERAFTNKEQFSGLPVWMACYIAYDRHSERENNKKFERIEELDVMKLLPNNSLGNPIVEQVIRETLFVVKDLWEKYGQPDEIHIELGRELKKNAKEKEKASKNNAKNFEEKIRIKKLLSELINEDFKHYDEDGEIINAPFKIKPNPDSPLDIEKFRVYKNCGAITSDEEKENWDILFKDGKKERVPTNAEIKKYTLWLSQKCMSPYTRKIIPLSSLFDESQYQIEHIIPKSKLKYDAFENLVIAEAAINPHPYKGNMLARIFIQHFSNQDLKIGEKIYHILSNEEYESHCKNTFKGRKLKNLLATEVPDDFVERQINDTRYITRKISELLYPVAKDKSGLVFTIGSITSDLKREWGLNKEWKKMLLPRFERLGEIIDCDNSCLKGGVKVCERDCKHKFISQNKKDRNDIDINVSENEELELKRIDHRHHALDAIIIAATTREHIRYLNSLSAVDNDIELQQVKRALVKGKIRDFKLPWEKFTEDAKNSLAETIVTFKSNNKIVSKPRNRYLHWVEKEDKTWEKKEDYQQKPDNPNKKWMAVRKSMFKEPQGIIWIKKKDKEVPVLEAFKIQIERLKVEYDKEKRKTASYIYDQTARPILKDIILRIGIEIEDTEELLKAVENYLKKNSKSIATNKVDKNGKTINKTIYILNDYEYERIRIAEFVEHAAKRVKVDSSFTQEKINKIPYSFAKDNKWNLAKHLTEHLKEYENDSEKKASDAFTGEGLEALAKKNNGKKISKVTIYEKKSPDDKFGNKYVEVDAGANAYFIIYENEKTRDRKKMYSLSTHKAIERLVQGKPLADIEDGYKTIILSPNDLVYVPTTEELVKIKQGEPDAINWNDKRKIAGNIYKMNSCTGSKCEFVPHRFVNNNPIIDKIEFGANNINQRAWDGNVQLVSNGKDGFKREDTGTMIKDICIKVQTDRLGNIKPIHQ